MITYRKLVALVSLVALLAPGVASAALVRLEQTGNAVRVLVDTEGQVINAFEGEIRVTGAAEASQVLTGESVVPLWVTRPSVESLKFAGIVPGGYEGASGQLFSVVLSGTPGSQATVSLVAASMLLNDGEGTPAQVRSLPVTVSISGEPQLGVRDSEVPEFSEAVVSRDDAIFGGAWFVAFNAQDAETGIERYEVAESLSGIGKANLVWKSATSPHQLADQTRRSTIFIKAIDGAGNEVVTSIEPEDVSGPYRYALIGIVLLAILVIVVAVIIRKTRMR